MVDKDLVTYSSGKNIDFRLKLLVENYLFIFKVAFVFSVMILMFFVVKCCEYKRPEERIISRTEEP